MRLTRQQLEQWLQALNNLAQDPGVVLGLSDVMEELDQLLPPDQQFRELPLPTGGSIGALDDEDTLDLLASEARAMMVGGIDIKRGLPAGSEDGADKDIWIDAAIRAWMADYYDRATDYDTFVLRRVLLDLSAFLGRVQPPSDARFQAQLVITPVQSEPE